MELLFLYRRFHKSTVCLLMKMAKTILILKKCIHYDFVWIVHNFSLKFSLFFNVLSFRDIWMKSGCRVDFQLKNLIWRDIIQCGNQFLWTLNAFAQLQPKQSYSDVTSLNSMAFSRIFHRRGEITNPNRLSTM